MYEKWSGWGWETKEGNLNSAARKKHPDMRAPMVGIRSFKRVVSRVEQKGGREEGCRNDWFGLVMLCRRGRPLDSPTRSLTRSPHITRSHHTPLHSTPSS